MYRKRFTKVKGKVNKIPLNVLTRAKGQRKTKFQVSKELITLHTSFVEYENSKSNTSIHKEIDDAAQYEGIDDNSYHDNSSPPCKSYVKRKMRAAERWEEVRAGLQRIILHKHLLCEGTICFNCQNLAVVRCHQCGPYLYCMDCCNQFHRDRNFYHSPEIWKVHMLCP